VLDCACNAGGHLLEAKRQGAGRCFGFDVREHWIEQARFLARHRAAPRDGMRFEVQDLYELPRLGLDRFDVTLFNGIFYHVPEPLAALRVAADLTGDVALEGANFQIASLQGADLTGAKLQNADFSSASIMAVRVTRCGAPSMAVVTTVPVRGVSRYRALMWSGTPLSAVSRKRVPMATPSAP